MRPPNIRSTHSSGESSFSGNAEEAKISGEFVPTWMEDRPLVSTGRTSLIIGAEGGIPPLTADAQKRGGAAGPPTADSPRRTVGYRTVPSVPRGRTTNASK